MKMVHEKRLKYSTNRVKHLIINNTALTINNPVEIEGEKIVCDKR